MTRPSSDFFKSSSIQSSIERIEASQFSMRYSSTRRSCANWGRANVGNVHNNNNQPSKKDQIMPLGSSHYISLLRKTLVWGGHFRQLGSITSCRNYRWRDSM